MSSSLTPQQVAEQALKEKAELEAKVKYLRTQLGQLLHEKRRNLRISRSSRKSKRRNLVGDSNDAEYERCSRKHHRPRERRYNNFKIDILEFDGQLDLDLFLYWLQTVERVFEFKDIPEKKKVKLTALKLRKYASI